MNQDSNRLCKSWHNPRVLRLLEASGCDDPVAAVLKYCRDLVAESEIYKPPVDLKKLRLIQSERLKKKIDLRFDRLSRKRDGVRVNTKGKITIFVNKSNTVQRQNFTLCHELAHTIFDLVWPEDYTQRQRESIAIHKQEEEYLCEIAASELLIPTHFIEPFVTQRGTYTNQIGFLSNLFQASKKAVAIKMIKVSRDAVIALFWEYKYQYGSGTHLRISGFEKPDSHLDLFIPINSTIRSHNKPLVKQCFEIEKPTMGQVQLSHGDLQGRFYIDSICVLSKDYRRSKLDSNFQTFNKKLIFPEDKYVITFVHL